MDFRGFVRTGRLGGLVRSATRIVLPIRGHLGSIKQLMHGDLYIGRDSRNQNTKFEHHLRTDQDLNEALWQLSGARLVCHCRPGESCHADVSRTVFSERIPDAYDRVSGSAKPPTAQVLNYMAKLREVPEQSDGSSADEGAPERGAGWVGHGPPIEVCVDVSRELCDGQSLASPGRWSPEQRSYPQHEQWKAIVKLFEKFANTYGTEELLTSLALGKVAECPFPSDEVKNLKAEVVRCADGYDLRREAADRIDTPIDFRFLQLLLTVAGDPEVHLGDFSMGVRVGPGARLPRLPALSPAKKRWRLTEQGDARNYLEQVDTVSMWRTNYASSDVFSDKVLVVLEDQATRGQVIKMTEHEARRRYPDLVVAALGAQRKDKPGRAVSARVLFDRTQTRIRDQERGPIAADMKRVMREKSSVRVPTFAFTADVSEAHRQIPIAERDWHLLVVRFVWRCVSILLLVTCCLALSTWQAARLTRGTCWLLTTTILMRAAQTTEQHCFTFSPSPQQRTYLCHGARLQGVTWFRWWGLNSFTELGCSESRKEGPTG